MPVSVVALVPPPLLGVPPVISSLTESSKKWSEHKGTTFSYTLSTAATVTLEFTQRASGRRAGKKCVAPTRKLRKKPSCERTIIDGRLTLTGHAGQNTVKFAGRLSAHKRLSPGTYTVILTATADGLVSKPSALRFTIVKG